MFPLIRICSILYCPSFSRLNLHSIIAAVKRVQIIKAKVTTEAPDCVYDTVHNLFRIMIVIQFQIVLLQTNLMLCVFGFVQLMQL